MGNSKWKSLKLKLSAPQLKQHVENNVAYQERLCITLEYLEEVGMMVLTILQSNYPDCFPEHLYLATKDPPWTATAILRKNNKVGGITRPVFSYSNQNSTVLVPHTTHTHTKHTYRSMQQNREPRNKSTHLWSINLQQRRLDYTMEKKAPLISSSGKTGKYIKEWN